MGQPDYAPHNPADDRHARGVDPAPTQQPGKLHQLPLDRLRTPGGREALLFLQEPGNQEVLDAIVSYATQKRLDSQERNAQWQQKWDATPFLLKPLRFVEGFLRGLPERVSELESAPWLMGALHSVLEKHGVDFDTFVARANECGLLAVEHFAVAPIAIEYVAAPVVLIKHIRPTELAHKLSNSTDS